MCNFCPKKSSYRLNQKEVNIFICYASGLLTPSPLTLLFLSLSLGLWVSLLPSSTSLLPLALSTFKQPLSRSVNSWGDAGSVTRPGGPRSRGKNTRIADKQVFTFTNVKLRILLRFDPHLTADCHLNFIYPSPDPYIDNPYLKP